MKRIAVCLVLMGMALATGRQVLAQTVYFTQQGEVWRAGPDGSGPAPLLSTFATAVAVNPAEEKLYITGDLPLGGLLPTGRIWRANLDGSDRQELISSWNAPVGIAIQPAVGNFAAGKMYWVEAATVRRADLDGGRIETLVNAPSAPDSIALDLLGGKMYWTRSSGDEMLPAVQRANLDGSNVESLLMLPGPTSGIAIDPVGGRMFFGFVDSRIDGLFAGMIISAALDGSDARPIVSGLLEPAGVAWDPVAEQVYFIDGPNLPEGGRLWRVNHDGEGMEELIGNLRYARGLAFDPTPIPEPAGLWLLAAGAALRRRRR